MSERRISVELVARTVLSSRVHQLRFRALTPFRWRAGQHLVVVQSQGQAVFLPYSLASAYDPKKPGEFELAASYHSGADAMDTLPLGGKLEIEGPAGDFIWQLEPSPAALLVGVGTGIAPLRALVQEELARPSATRLLLLAGHRAPEDVLFEVEFAEWARVHSRFHFIPTLTGGGADWGGQRGRVQAQLVEAANSLGTFDAYVCGRLDMVREVVAILENHGVPAARIRSEGF